MRISLKALQANASNRPEGYVEDVKSHGKVVDEYLEIELGAYRKLLAKYNPAGQMPTPKCCGNSSPVTQSLGTGSYTPAPEFPPLHEQLKNAAGAAGRVIGAAFTGNRIKASDAKIKAREDICNTCEFNKGNRCLKCGCYWKFKMTLDTEKCPVGRW